MGGSRAGSRVHTRPALSLFINLAYTWSHMNKQVIIGVSGGPGSFSEQAAKYYSYKQGITPKEIKCLISAENVLTALDQGKINLGVFPIENSNGGIVYEAVYAMAGHQFAIQELFEIDVKHCLIVRPGVKREDITLVASHDQAIKQCRMYIKRLLPNVEVRIWADTADAVRALAAGELPTTGAAIASRGAAELYKMKIIEEGIQDLKFNFTTFLAVTKAGKKATVPKSKTPKNAKNLKTKKARK